MSSGNLTLLEASKWSTDPLVGTVVETLIQESPILLDLPMVNIVGDSIRVRIEDSIPDGQFRNVNEGYTAEHGEDTQEYFGVAILGTEVKVDRFLAANYTNPVSAKAIQWNKATKAISRKFDKTFFDGVGTAAAKDFMGVNGMISLGYGQTFAAGTNGATITLDMLDSLIDYHRQYTPDVLYMNRTVKTQVKQKARNYSGGSLLDMGHDALGRPVEMYAGIPFKVIGDDSTGSAILGFDETQGSSSVTSSVYGIKFGANEHLFGLMGAGGSMTVKDFGEIEAAPQHLGRIELYPGLACANRYSIVRLTGVLAA